MYTNEIPNIETIEAIEEVEKLKEDLNKTTYDSLEALIKEIENE